MPLYILIRSTGQNEHFLACDICHIYRKQYSTLLLLLGHKYVVCTGKSFTEIHLQTHRCFKHSGVILDPLLATS